jgi:mannose-1-phosphate guanylyltransferase
MLALGGPDPLLVQSVQRMSGIIPPERILVVTAQSLRAASAALLPQIPRDNILGEPRAASTGPALAWATATAARRDPDAAIIASHADWFVQDDDAFCRTAQRALGIAESFDMLVTVGIVPTRPDVGYGYIEPGDALDGDARRVRRFIEKPDAARAEALIKSGALWNSGMFAWTARRFFAETESVAPEIAPHVALLRSGDAAAFFSAVTPIAVDVSHFERSSRVAVIPGRFAWDDVGTWGALGRVRQTDDSGNVLVGDATAVDAAGNVVWSGDGPVVVFGVQDLVVVRANGVVLVTTRDRASMLKSMLEMLPARLRDLST